MTFGHAATHQYGVKTSHNQNVLLKSRPFGFESIIERRQYTSPHYRRSRGFPKSTVYALGERCWLFAVACCVAVTSVIESCKPGKDTTDESTVETSSSDSPTERRQKWRI